jgi:NACHT domain
VPLRVKVHVGIGRKARYEDKTTEEIIGLLNEEREQKADVRKTLAGVISGQAGAGKSFFMRNLYINLANSSLSKVPVFLEARELNANSLTDFAGLIAIAFRAAGQELSKEQAAEGLKSGIFLVLIDGFDELRLANERHYAKVLENAAQQFAECPILISGRPSELLHPTYFDQWELLPLERDETIELICKLDFDEATRASFIALMGKELFGSHAEFLEIPLLCVVMFLTYSDAGRISRKKHEFYEDAFNALWSKHDARKQGSYEREKYTGLDKNDFVRLLSAFCASSYVAEHFSMRESDLAHHLLSAKKINRCSCEGRGFRQGHDNFDEPPCLGM